MRNWRHHGHSVKENKRKQLTTQNLHPAVFLKDSQYFVRFYGDD